MTFLLRRGGPHRVAHARAGPASATRRCVRMRLGKLAGQPVPMLLQQDGLQRQRGVRRLPRGASTRPGSSPTTPSAFDTLVRHGADGERRVRELPRGRLRQAGRLRDRASARPDARERRLRGLPRARRPAPLAGLREGRHAYEDACLTCHDPKHSLGFEYATLPAAHLARGERARSSRCRPTEREKLLAERGARAQGSAADRGRLRRLGGLPDLPRRRARDLVDRAAREGDRDARRRRARPATPTACAATPPASASPAASRPAAPARARDLGARRLRVVPRARRRPRRGGRARSAARSSRSATSATRA